MKKEPIQALEPTQIVTDPKYAAFRALDPFFNINVPDDLAQAARLLQSMAS